MTNKNYCPCPKCFFCCCGDPNCVNNENGACFCSKSNSKEKLEILADKWQELGIGTQEEDFQEFVNILTDREKEERFTITRSLVITGVKSAPPRIQRRKRLTK